MDFRVGGSAGEAEHAEEILRLWNINHFFGF